MSIVTTLEIHRAKWSLAVCPHWFDSALLMLFQAHLWWSDQGLCRWSERRRFERARPASVLLAATLSPNKPPNHR